VPIVWRALRISDCYVPGVVAMISSGNNQQRYVIVVASEHSSRSRHLVIVMLGTAS
jgi:hypothetical protein